MAYSVEELAAWNAAVQAYPGEFPDYHRAQLERWLWDNRDRMQGRVLDVGAGWKRSYLPWSITLNTDGYYGPVGGFRPDIGGSITHLPFKDGSIGAIICAETLEHVPNLFRAVQELKRVLRPGGWLFITTPFLWPEHDTDSYGDYWRITEQAYRFMFADFETLQVQRTVMAKQADIFWGMTAGEERMGDGWATRAPTGYLVAGRKTG